ncbi:hypothetical protein Pelo_10305 [Pelomyxa schiedti]|nr:hypothetical protein Pelo_10305 [Pelomyxa schiedti]
MRTGQSSLRYAQVGEHLEYRTSNTVFLAEYSFFEYHPGLFGIRAALLGRGSVDPTVFFFSTPMQQSAVAQQPAPPSPESQLPVHHQRLHTQPQPQTPEEAVSILWRQVQAQPQSLLECITRCDQQTARRVSAAARSLLAAVKEYKDTPLGDLSSKLYTARDAKQSADTGRDYRQCYTTFEKARTEYEEEVKKFRRKLESGARVMALFRALIEQHRFAASLLSLQHWCAATSVKIRIPGDEALIPIGGPPCRSTTETHPNNKWLQLRQSGSFSDMTITSSDGVAFKCHRGIFSNSSVPLQNMLKSRLSEGSGSHSVRLPQLKSTAVESLLDFLYTRAATINYSETLELFNFCVMYEVNPLKEKLQVVLRNSVSTSTCCTLLEIGYIFNDTPLLQRSCEFIKTHITALNSEVVFDSIRPEDLAQLLPTAAYLTTKEKFEVLEKYVIRNFPDRKNQHIMMDSHFRAAIESFSESMTAPEIAKMSDSPIFSSTWNPFFLAILKKKMKT